MCVSATGIILVWDNSPAQRLHSFISTVKNIPIESRHTNNTLLEWYIFCLLAQTQGDLGDLCAYALPARRPGRLMLFKYLSVGLSSRCVYGSRTDLVVWLRQREWQERSVKVGHMWVPPLGS